MAVPDTLKASAALPTVLSSVTVLTSDWPSLTEPLLLTLLTPAGASEVSLTVALALTPPTVSTRVSGPSVSASSTITAVMLKLPTPAGTFSVPSSLRVTPSLNASASWSAAVAVPDTLKASAALPLALFKLTAATRVCPSSSWGADMLTATAIEGGGGGAGGSTGSS